MNDNPTVTDKDKPIPAGRIVFGLALLAGGILAFLDSIDLWEPRDLWQYWPVLLIVVGVANEIDALRKRTSGCGSVMIGIGVWMLAGSQHFLGLSYRTAFPLGVIVVGLGLILHAILDIPKAKEHRHDVH